MLVEFAWCSGFREYAYLLTKITKKKREEKERKILKHKIKVKLWINTL